MELIVGEQARLLKDIQRRRPIAVSLQNAIRVAQRISEGFQVNGNGRIDCRWIQDLERHSENRLQQIWTQRLALELPEELFFPK